MFVVSGPSGVGKTTVIERLLPRFPALNYSVSHTTRRRREEEVDGEDYHFISKERFENMKEKGKFLEWAEVFGQYYGTSVETVEGIRSREADAIMDIDVQGAEKVRDKGLNDVVYIFIGPPSEEELEKRIARRGSESAREMKLRLKIARRELAEAHKFDYLVINKDLDRCVCNFKSIISAERLRIAASTGSG